MKNKQYMFDQEHGDETHNNMFHQEDGDACKWSLCIIMLRHAKTIKEN